MRAKIFAIPLLVMASLASAVAEDSSMCPFMTRGSAAKLLGGEVTVAVDSTGDRDGSCRFTRQQGELTYTLAVVVHKTAINPCPQHSMALKAVGNEALLCRVEHSPTETIEKASGRVRDMFFTVDLTIRGPAKSAMPVDSQREAIDIATELVTGNLY